MHICEVVFLFAEILLAASGKPQSAYEEGALSPPDCGGLNETILFENDHFNGATTTSLTGFQNGTLTILIPWDGGSEGKAALQWDLAGFQSGLLTNCGVVVENATNSAFGDLYIRDSEYILIPDFSKGKSLRNRLSRLLLFRNLIKTVEGLRIVVAVDSNHTHADLPEASRTALIQTFVLLKGLAVPVHVVIVENGSSATSDFRNFIFFRSRVNETLNSCETCTPHTLSWWLTPRDDISGNFPSIRYVAVEVKSLREIFEDAAAADREMQNAYADLLHAMRCLVHKKMVQIALRMREYLASNATNFDALNDLYRSQVSFATTIEAPESVDDESVYRVGTFGDAGLRAAEHEAANGSRGRGRNDAETGVDRETFVPGRKVVERLEEIVREFVVANSSASTPVLPLSGNARRNSTSDETHEVLLKIRDLVEDIESHNLGNGSGDVGSPPSPTPLPTPGGVPGPASRARSDSLATSAPSETEEGATLERPPLSCSENFSISGTGLDSDAITNNCAFMNLKIVASKEFKIKSNLTLPWSNINLETKKLVSEGSFYIDLSAKDCISGVPPSAEGAGFFRLSAEEFEGAPLTVVVNGGKGCRGRDSPEEIRNLPIVELVDGECVPVRGPLFRIIWEKVYKATDGEPGTKKGKVSIIAGDGSEDWTSHVKVVAFEGAKGDHGRTGLTKIYCDDEKFFPMMVEKEEDDDGDGKEGSLGKKWKLRRKPEDRDRDRIEESPFGRSNKAESDFISSLTYRDQIHVFTSEIASTPEASGEELVTWINIANEYRKMFHRVTVTGGSRMYDAARNGSGRETVESPSRDDVTHRTRTRTIRKESRSGVRGHSADCYPVPVGRGDEIYVLPCGINATDTRKTSRSRDVAAMLNNAFIDVVDCREVSQEHIAEFYLITCTGNSLSLDEPATLNGNLTCFAGLTENSVACRLTKNGADFDEITGLELEYLSVILAAKYARMNPGKAMSPMLTDDGLRKLAAATQETKSSGALRDAYLDNYRSLAAAYDLYFDKILRPATRFTLPKLRDKFFALLADLENGATEAAEELALALRLNAFLDFEIVRRSRAEGFLRDFILDAKATESSHRQQVRRIWGEEMKDLLLDRASAVSLCLGLAKSEIEKEGFPEELGNMISAVLKQFSERLKETMSSGKEMEKDDGNGASLNAAETEEEEEGEVAFAFALKHRSDDIEHLLQNYTNIVNRLKEDLENLQKDLRGEYRSLFDTTMGAYLRTSDYIPDLVRSMTTMVRTKTDLERIFPYANVIALNGKGEYQNVYTEYEKYKMYVAASFGEEPEVFRSAKPVNDLYLSMLRGVREDRERLRNASARFANVDFVASLKSKIDIGLDLEREVYKALQMVRLTEYVERGTVHLARRDVPEELDAGNADAMERIRQGLKDELAYLKLECAKKSLEQRVFPLAEKLDPEVTPEAVEGSFRRVKSREREYYKYVTAESRDPDICADSCVPFYSWSADEVNAHGQSIEQLFLGQPLFLVADARRSNPNKTIKGKNFRIRFVARGRPGSTGYESALKKIANHVAGTTVRLARAAFAYNAYASRLYLSPANNSSYECILGNATAGSESGGHAASPYTLWQIRLVSVGRNARKIRSLIGGVELVGEGEVLADGAALLDVHERYRNHVTAKERERIWLDLF